MLTSGFTDTNSGLLGEGHALDQPSTFYMDLSLYIIGYLVFNDICVLNAVSAAYSAKYISRE